jgi:hypothetical protein
VTWEAFSEVESAMLSAAGGGRQIRNAALVMRFVPVLHICWPHIQVRKQRFKKASGIPSIQAIWKVSLSLPTLHNSASMA